MDSFWKRTTWNQFGAAIDMLADSMRLCPEEHWSDPEWQPPFWRMAYHTIFWLDFYLSKSPVGFTPPEPFDPNELEPSGLAPERVYTKAEQLAYLEHCRRKCRDRIEEMDEAEAGRKFEYGTVQLSVAELLLYNLRHVQHHTAQMNMMLRQKIDDAPRWVRQAR